MHAFGLEETGAYEAAEAAGREALEAEPRNAWNTHAVAQSLEMQGRSHQALDFMRWTQEDWGKNSALAIHNWWHLCLFLWDEGRHTDALEVYDAEVFADGRDFVQNLVDSTAILWRLQLMGAEPGDRWRKLAAAWTEVADGGWYLFNDIHAVFAYAAAGDDEGLDRMAAVFDEAAAARGDNAVITAEIGRPAAAAAQLFSEGAYARVVEMLAPVRSRLIEIGGSHAQRDLFQLTLIEAARRAGSNDLARQFARERSDFRTENGMVERMMAEVT
jgi:tetratricopeptide (TPR) repeat protein